MLSFQLIKLMFSKFKLDRVKKHKDDCMCAICVMMRRRQEREANAQSADDHIESSGGLSVQQKARAEVHIILKRLGTAFCPQPSI